MKKILALIAAVSLAALTACGNTNTAATLGKISITQTELQTTVDTVLKERTGVDTSQMQLENGGALNRSQLRFKIITTIFDEIAKELKIEVTKSEMTTMRSEMIAQGGGASTLQTNLVSAQIASTSFDRYIRAIIISNKITQALQDSGIAAADVNTKISELVSAKANQLKVSINPRYGTWDQTNGDIVATDSAGTAVQVPSSNLG